LINNEKSTNIRISDLIGVIPSITGKVELAYEGKQEGPVKVANILIGKAIKTQFAHYFPSPDKVKKKSESNPYQEIVAWFSKGNHVDLLTNLTNDQYKKVLFSIPGLKELINKFHPDESEENKLLLMEFALHGLSEYSILSKYHIDFGLQFKDMLSSMFSSSEQEEYGDEGEDYR